MNFLQRLKQSKEESSSKICVGLDLATFGTRDKNFMDKDQDKTTTLLSLIDNLYPHCCAFKINRQYILDLTLDEIKQVTAKSHEVHRPIIIDHKLSDIGSTNEQAIFHFTKEGFDGFTASPFPGNIEEICETSHNHNLAVIILILMSNPEAKWMKDCTISSIPIYQYNCRLANKYADGIVVGTTGHVTNHDLKIIRKEVSNKVILSPGIGAQGGDLELILTLFEEDVIFNISRGVIYQESPIDALKAYNRQVQEFLGK